MQNDYTEDSGFTPSFLARFDAKLEATPSGCIEWRGIVTRSLYGECKLRMNDKWVRARAHRVQAQRHFPATPILSNSDTIVRHTCDNPCCCNPEHFLLGSHADNVRDRVARSRSATGSANGRAVLTEPAVKLMRFVASEHGSSHADLALIMGIDRGTVKKAIAGTTWKHV